MLRGPHQPLALEAVDASCSAAKCIAIAQTYFYEHDGRAVLRDHVQLPFAIPDVPRKNPATVFDQMCAGRILSCIPGALFRCSDAGRTAPQVAHSVCSSLSIFPERKTASVGQRSTRGLRPRST